MKWIIALLWISTAQAGSIYTTKDEADSGCVPVHVSEDLSVRYDAEAQQWQDVLPADAQNGRSDENIIMNFRIPPSRINNKAFQRHIGTSEVFVGGYASGGNQDAISVLGNSSAQPTQECPF